MNRFVVALVGGIASGKTAVGRNLVGRFHDAVLISARSALLETLRLDNDAPRGLLQKAGSELDKSTDGYWLSSYSVLNAVNSKFVVIDSLRTLAQIQRMREAFPDLRVVFLSADEGTRRSRYASGRDEDYLKAGMSFDAASDHGTELGVCALAKSCDLVVDTARHNVDAVSDQILTYLRLAFPHGNPAAR